MEKLQNEVYLTLRESETCLAATELYLTRTESQTNPPKDPRRVLAVVSHQYLEDAGHHAVIPRREGCLFVMKYKSTFSPELYPHLLVPIDSKLSLSLNQRESPISNSELELSISTPKGSYKLISVNTQSLYDLLEECRRLRRSLDPYSSLSPKPSNSADELADEKLDILLENQHGAEEFDSHWQWLHYYLNRRFSRIVPFIQSKPHDIRYIDNEAYISSTVTGLQQDEESDIAFIRDHWAHRQLVKRKSEYSEERQLTVRIGTFNVNGSPPVQDIYSWVWGKEPEEGPSLQTPKSTSASLLPDLLVFGFQEIDQSPETLLYSTAASVAKCTAWAEAIATAMGEASEDFVMIASQQLVGVFIVIFLRRKLREHVKDITSATAAVGFMGFLANKGATAVRLTLYSTTITFVCSHLAAFDDNAEKRNSDFNELCRKLSLPLQCEAPRNAGPLTATIWETDILFWLGDLNYRIDLPDDEIRLHLLNHPHDLDELQGSDQLLKSKELEKAFVGFIEDRITFKPTYRFADGPLKDDLGYDTKRRPAWTDRILHRCAHSVSVSQTGYQGHPSITQSDHHPVSADFDITVLEINARSHHSTMKSIFQSLGDFEDSSETPEIEFSDGAEIDFGDLWYDKAVTKFLTIKNIGKKALVFRFIPEQVELDKRWLSITPSSDLLLPGKSISIDLTVVVNRLFAAKLNTQPELHEQLHLHLLRGGDYTISISGLYKRSCFAISLPQLSASKTPARFVNTLLTPGRFDLNCPRELMFLINWLMSNGSEYSGLFLEPADEELIFTIREYLDTQPLDSVLEVPLSNSDTIPKEQIAYAYSQTLLRLLTSLQDPIIPTVLYPQCAQAQSREDVFEILNYVPGYTRTTFITVTSFVHFISQNRKPEELEALTKVFANVFFREGTKPTLGIPSITPLRKREFIRYLIS